VGGRKWHKAGLNNILGVFLFLTHLIVLVGGGGGGRMGKGVKILEVNLKSGGCFKMGG